MDAALDGPGLRHVPGLPDPVQLKLSLGKHHPLHHLARGGGGVDALSDREELGPGIIQALEHRQRVEQRPAEPVQLGDHDPIRLATLGPLHRRGEAGAVVLAPD